MLRGGVAWDKDPRGTSVKSIRTHSQRAVSRSLTQRISSDGALVGTSRRYRVWLFAPACARRGLASLRSRISAFALPPSPHSRRASKAPAHVLKRKSEEDRMDACPAPPSIPDSLSDHRAQARLVRVHRDDREDFDVHERLVVLVALDLLDALHHVHALLDAPEDRVLVVEPRGGRGGCAGGT